MTEHQSAASLTKTSLPILEEPKGAHVVSSADEAIEIAKRFAAKIAEGASERDRQRHLPVAEIAEFTQSGLWSLNVPKEYGGPDLSYSTIAEVISIVAAADPSIGQLPQNHIDFIDTLRTTATPEQRAEFFRAILAGTRSGNAFSELGSRTAADFETKITRRGDDYVVNGRKFYSSGALLAHIVPITTVDPEGRLYIAVADRNARGLTIIDDWSSFGQRTTASGTVIIEDLVLPASRVIPTYTSQDSPSANGAVCQIVHAAVDTGIARRAIEDTIAFVRNSARPWIDSGKAKAVEDPYTISDIGDLKIKLHATEALLARAGRVLDAAVANPTVETVAAASIAVAKAKVLSTDLALLATNKLFEHGGARSTLLKNNFDRHWRNARVHTVHDPVRWKHPIIGNYYLNHVLPPRHSWI
ncbi:SfnB family sulfur acquisition oxidoreductase [Hyphomicrobium sp. 2TAF46]|uniref:SfnB family sulfur acquisition oxidoreductase n=1 Tax=Hyphomicrobium sp. 2TAF46 TaxID=3233019 RepID=UPI003F92EE44